MPRYKTSDGEYVEKSVIDRRIREAKAEIYNDRLHPCEATGQSPSVEPIDMSHVISVNDCQRLGKSDLAWSQDNIYLECRSAHRDWEDMHPRILKHRNFRSKMDYLKQHHRERFITIIHKLNLSEDEY